MHPANMCSPEELTPIPAFDPGAEYREDWECGTRAAASGGYTLVMEMPGNGLRSLIRKHLTWPAIIRSKPAEKLVRSYQEMWWKCWALNWKQKIHLLFYNFYCMRSMQIK